MTERRQFIRDLAMAALVPPSIAGAQATRKLYRIGILVPGLASNSIGAQPSGTITKAFLRGMRDLGYVYGEHFVTEPRGAEGKPERFPALVAELAAMQVDVIVGSGPSLPALKRANTSIPIVMSSAGDPVGQGYVQSLAHPGGNFTGLSSQSLEAVGKRLQLVKELVPGAGPVAVVWDRLGNLVNWQITEAAARARGWKLLSLEIQDIGDLEGALKSATEARSGALLVCAAGVLYPHTQRVAELAARSRLPAMYEQRPYVDAGGLISYGANFDEIWHRAASFVDKILKGAKPADLAVEQPTKFELVINIKAAKALGLTLPQSLMLRADEVIE